MLRKAIAIGLIGITGCLFALVATADKPADGFKGNGLPKISMDESWQVNIHATDTCPGGDFDDSNRRVIVVQSLSMAGLTAANVNHGNKLPDTSALNDIWLAPSDHFEVVDGNACDAGVDDNGDDIGAELLLPANISTNFDLYVKFRGAPGTKLDPVLCAVDEADVTTTWCNVGNGIVTRSTGKGAMQFRDYTDILLNVEDILDICAGNVCDLFEAGVEGWFWDWSGTDGAKATLVFVPCSDPKTGDDPTLEPCVF